jgi:hypothetical protein
MTLLDVLGRFAPSSPRSLAAFAAIVLASCQGGASGPPPPVLVFAEYWPQLPLSLVAEIHSGQVSLDDVRVQSAINRAPHCGYAADFSNPQQPPRLRVNGQPGTPGFNVQLEAHNLVEASNLAEPCNGPWNVTDVLMQPTEGIMVGTLTRVGSAQFTLPSNSSFTTATGVFEFTLTAIDQDTGSGSFRYLTTNDNDPRDQRVLFMTGSFTASRF